MTSLYVSYGNEKVGELSYSARRWSNVHSAILLSEAGNGDLRGSKVGKRAGKKSVAFISDVLLVVLFHRVMTACFRGAI